MYSYISYIYIHSIWKKTHATYSCIYIYNYIHITYMYIYNYNASDLKFTLAPCIAFFLGRPISESWLGHDFWPWQYTHVYSCNITCSRSINSFGGSIVVGYHNSWTVYNGKSENNMDDLGVPPWLRKLHFIRFDSFWFHRVLDHIWKHV